MKVFLKEDVKHVGNIGDIVNVADGYARNYLIPKSLAVEANTKNIKEFEHHKRIIQEKAAKVKDASRSLAEKLSSLVLTIRAKAGDEDKLFGSVTSMDIAEALKADGYDIDRKKISIEEPIKRLGEHSVEIKVLADISAHVKVNVISEASE
ncbi:MAG: 50S ribosomal protein L9 [Candidatus Sulfobium sp.]